jgi:protocatechuate 3,4-dioxygenase beta subunit
MRGRAAVVAALTLAAPSGWAGVAGRVLAPDGAPVAGAAVEAHAPETPDQRSRRLLSGRPRAALGSARTGPDGTFSLAVDAPVLALTASADGFAPAFALALPGAPATFQLQRAATRRGVVTAAGRPLAGARVVWLPSGHAASEWAVTTAADGSYLLPDPEKWSSQSLVLHPDFAPLDSQEDAFAPRAPLDRSLDAGVALAGTVVDEGGRPVAGAEVWVEAAGRWPMATTAADGRFSVAHAPRKWQTVRARTRSLAGEARRAPGRLSVVVRAARSLSGTVRDAATGQPLAGSLVSAVRFGGSETALTDAAGGYRLDALPVGRYRVTSSRPGFAAHSREVDLRAAPVRHDIALARRPTLRGRVQDEAGRPIEGALVALGFKATAHVYAPDPFDQFEMDDETCRTEADGSFTLPLPAESGAGMDIWKDRPLIVLKRGYAAARADLKGPRADPLVVTLARGIELTGRVTREDGTPLPGVAVTLAEDGSLLGTMIPSHFVIANLAGEGWTTSGADGRFQARVHPAVHHLAFRGPGLAPKLVRGYDPRAGTALEVVMDRAAALRGRVVRPDGRGVADVQITASRPMEFQSAEAATSGPDGAFEVQDLAPGTYELAIVQWTLGIQLKRTVEAPVTDLQLVLEPSGSLKGHVVDGATRQPVTAFRLGLYWAQDGERPAGGRQADVEDAGGAFVLADVPARDVGVTVSAEGYATRRIEAVSVPPGGEAPDQDIALEAELPIRGRVTGEDKAGIPEAVVRVSSKGEHQSVSARTDDQGEYELRGVAPGEFALTFEASGFLSEKRTLDTRQSARLDVTLRRGLSLTGVVVGDGAAVPSARVSAASSMAGAQYAHANTDERGRFKLEGLVPGRYTVSASAEGKGKGKLEDVDPESSGPLRLVLERSRRAVLTGKVVGLPAAGEQPLMVMVMARNDEEEPDDATALVEAAGTFRLDDAPAGRVTVRAEASTGESSRQSRSVELTLAPGAEAEVVLEFPEGVVSGQVTRDGRPVAGMQVSFSAPAAPGASSRTDVRGNYEVAGLQPGRYTVTVSGDGTSYEVDHVVSGSGEFDIDITGGSLQGRVVRADDGTPVPGVSVVLWPLGTRENRPADAADSNGQGEFALRSLREGRYRVTTSKKGYGQEVRELAVTRGATAGLLLELSPAAGVTVSVVDARDGHALEATVVVRDGARRIVANSHSGVEDDGALNIPLADGAYLLSTSASGYGTATVPVTAPSQGLRVSLTPGGTLEIESAQERQGLVRLVQPDGEEYVQCWCNGIAEIQLQGRRTKVEHVTPGSYTLELIGESEVLARKPVVVREGQKTTVTID